MKVKWDISFSDTIMGACNLDESSLGSCLCYNPDTVPATQHKQVFRQFVFGPFISPGIYKDHVRSIRTVTVTSWRKVRTNLSCQLSANVEHNASLSPVLKEAEQDVGHF